MPASQSHQTNREYCGRIDYLSFADKFGTIPVEKEGIVVTGIATKQATRRSMN